MRTLGRNHMRPPGRNLMRPPGRNLMRPPELSNIIIFYILFVRI
jgi:hypothetical protein